MMSKRSMILCLSGAILGLAACTPPARPLLEKGRLLSQAGFIAHSADTTARYTMMNQLPPDTLTFRMAPDGHKIYLYADPIGCGCVYMGDQNAYRLVLNSPVAQKKHLAAGEDQMFAENRRDSTPWDWTAWSPSADPGTNQPKYMIGSYW